MTTRQVKANNNRPLEVPQALVEPLRVVTVTYGRVRGNAKRYPYWQLVVYRAHKLAL